MSYENRTRLKVLHHTILALVDIAADNPLSHYLSLSVDATLDGYTDMLRSAPDSRGKEVVNVLPCQLSITVSASGELTISESSILTKPPGSSSPLPHSPADSYQSRSEPLMGSNRLTPQNKALESPILLCDHYPCLRALGHSGQHSAKDEPVPWKHSFEGMLDENCVHCNMPYNAKQHGRMLVHAGIVVVDPPIDFPEGTYSP